MGPLVPDADLVLVVRMKLEESAKLAGHHLELAEAVSALWRET
jgi:hypothetical protein